MERAELRVGIALAGSAYLLWGLSPAYFKLLQHVDPVRVLAHRGLWAGALSLLLVVVFQRAAWRAWWAGTDRASSLRTLALSAALLASNWGVYIHAVTTNQVIETSLGYFVSPLVTVAFGVIFAHERPRLAQWAAIALAALGVMQLALSGGSVPWLGLYLAASFSGYGMIRKQLALEPLFASSLEALMMVPASLAYLALVRPEPLLAASAEGALLYASGALTALPLMLFAAGAKRLPYVTLGLLQYLTPSLHLALAVFAYREPLDRARLVTFVLIWAALLCTSVDAGWRAMRARHAAVATR